jgi:hypothetical protein
VKLERRKALALFGRALLWLPLCLAAWYFASVPISWVGATLARPAINAAAGKIDAMKLDAATVTYSVRLVEPGYQRGRAPLEAVVDVEVKPRLYTFGLPFFLALALAARESRRVAAILAGSAVLAAVPAWGITFDALRQLGASGELAPLLAWRSGTREAIALGYQVGSLLLPTLGPIAVWLALFPNAWRGSPTARSGTP